VWRRIEAVVLIALGASLVGAGVLVGGAQAQPDVGESICAEAGFTGAALGLCRAYCEAQECGVWDWPSCAQLRARFAEKVGISIFPCDPFCGDGEVNQDFEECDPPATVCGSTGLGACNQECICVTPGDSGSTGDERQGRPMGIGGSGVCPRVSPSTPATRTREG
jgi:hypothetical protein